MCRLSIKSTALTEVPVEITTSPREQLISPARCSMIRKPVVRLGALNSSPVSTRPRSNALFAPSSPSAFLPQRLIGKFAAQIPGGYATPSKPGTTAA